MNRRLAMLSDRKHWMLLGVLGAFLLGLNAETLAQGRDRTKPQPSGTAPENRFREFTVDGGWDPANPLARIQYSHLGSLRSTLCGFADSGVVCHYAVPFSYPNYGKNQGWVTSRHIRTTGDVNGDQLTDIVGFGENHVYVSLLTDDGEQLTVQPPQAVFADFVIGKGYLPTKHPRFAADVNGDQKVDLVCFSDTGVMVSLNTSTATGVSFGAPSRWVANYGTNNGWNATRHVRCVEDINNDGRADVVGFGEDGVYVSLANSAGSAFLAPQRVSTDYTAATFGPGVVRMTAIDHLGRGVILEYRVVQVEGDRGEEIEETQLRKSVWADGSFQPAVTGAVRTSSYTFTSLIFLRPGELVEIMEERTHPKGC